MNLKICQRCRKVWYCSKDCQRDDWTKRHKTWCKEASSTPSDDKNSCASLVVRATKLLNKYGCGEQHIPPEIRLKKAGEMCEIIDRILAFPIAEQYDPSVPANYVVVVCDGLRNYVNCYLDCHAAEPEACLVVIREKRAVTARIFRSLLPLHFKAFYDFTEAQCLFRMKSFREALRLALSVVKTVESDTVGAKARAPLGDGLNVKLRENYAKEQSARAFCCQCYGALGESESAAGRAMQSSLDCLGQRMRAGMESS